MGNSPVTQDTTRSCPGTSNGGAVAAGCPVSAGGYTDLPEPLGPDSLTWKYFGLWTGLLHGPWAGSMQNMHPQLGAAVKDHSIFFTERIPRLLRSIYPIGGVVFDGDRAPQTAAEVRDYHIGIKGVDEKGRRYSALNPDVFYWAHATFFKSVLLAAEHFSGGLTSRRMPGQPWTGTPNGRLAYLAGDLLADLTDDVTYTGDRPTTAYPDPHWLPLRQPARPPAYPVVHPHGQAGACGQGHRAARRQRRGSGSASCRQ